MACIHPWLLPGVLFGCHFLDCNHIWKAAMHHHLLNYVQHYSDSASQNCDHATLQASCCLIRERTGVGGYDHNFMR